MSDFTKMSPKELIEYFKSKGVTDLEEFSSHTNDVVFDIKEDEGRALNSKGLEEQLGFIIHSKQDNLESLSTIVQSLIEDYEFFNKPDDDEEDDTADDVDSADDDSSEDEATDK